MPTKPWRQPAGADYDRHVRVLHVLWDGGGNLSPQLAIARELAARGHEVRVLGPRNQRARIEATGATFLSYRQAPDADASNPETDLVRDWEAKTPIGAFARIRDRLMFGPALLFARDVLEELERSPADVVAWDYLLLGAGIAAERAGVGSVALVHSVYPLPTPGVPPFGLGLMPARGAAGRTRDALLGRLVERMFAPGLKAVNQARAELELHPLKTAFNPLTGADLLLVLTAPEFDFAGSATLPANVRHTGPAFEATPGAMWESPWPADDTRPLVLASFSTTFMDQGDLAARAIEALGALPVRALMTTGPALATAALPRPDNVELRDFVPHLAVLSEADVVMTHAGMGTVHSALAAGVPLVCVPQGRDQNDVAARVVHHGAGVRTGPGASPRKLREAVSSVLADPSYQRAAERFAEQFARQDGAARAADELEAFA